MERPWFFDKTCDPTSMRQRAWRYGRNEEDGGIRLFHSMNKLADLIEEARENYRDDTTRKGKRVTL